VLNGTTRSARDGGVGSASEQPPRERSGFSAKRTISIEVLFVATFGLLGLRLGLRPMGDNSLFVHLRTGIDLVRTGHVPTRDPYSFSPSGAPWVVQSWLASLAYGVGERAGGLAWVRIEQGLLYGGLGLLVGTLARTGGARRTALAGALAAGIGAAYWSPRPLVFGLLGLALTLLVVERRWAWWWLVPIVWVWVNSHGSFVLGLGWLVLVAAGEWLDGGRRRPPVLPWLGGFVAGLVVACVNPLGVRLLVFPFVVLDRRAAFAEVAEWKPPFAAIARPGTALSLLCLAGVAVVAVRFRSRLRWRDALPLAAFAAAGLVAQRNLPMAGVVAAPVLARLLAAPSEDEDSRPPLHLALAGLLGALAVLFLAVAATTPALDLAGFPVRAAGLYDHPSKVLTTDVAAGYLLLRHRDRVWFDDRVDLHPVAKTKDYVRLLHGDEGAMAIVDRSGADVVLWKTDEELDAQLAASGRWRRVGVRDGWAVWVRGG
jgi:hypothetical protein